MILRAIMAVARRHDTAHVTHHPTQRYNRQVRHGTGSA